MKKAIKEFWENEEDPILDIIFSIMLISIFEAVILASANVNGLDKLMHVVASLAFVGTVVYAINTLGNRQVAAIWRIEDKVHEEAHGNYPAFIFPADTYYPERFLLKLSVPGKMRSCPIVVDLYAYSQAKINQSVVVVYKKRRVTRKIVVDSWKLQV